MYSLRITVEESRRMFPILFAMMVLSAMSISAWAKDDSSPISATIMLFSAAKVGNTQLPAGEYKVVADGSQVKFLQGRKVMVQVRCTLKDLSYTPKQTQVAHDDNGRISEIQIAGNTKAIELSY